MAQPRRNARRILVVGSTGSGKTTLARQLSHRLGIPHIEMDALHWGPDWTEVPDEQFRRRTSQAVSADSWVADGNYPVLFARPEYPHLAVVRLTSPRQARRWLDQAGLP